MAVYDPVEASKQAVKHQERALREAEASEAAAGRKRAAEKAPGQEAAEIEAKRVAEEAKRISEAYRKAKVTP